MAFLLLFQPLLQRLHQLVEAAQRLDLRLLLVGQIFFGQQPQPVLGDVGGQILARADRFHALEHRPEHLIEPVIVFLVLDQNRARQVIEGLDLAPRQIAIHGLHQMEPFLHRHRNLGVAQGGEEGEEHGKDVNPDQPRRKMNSWSRQAPTGYSYSPAFSNP